MNPYHVTENNTAMLETDTKNLSVPKNQPKHQVHSPCPNSDTEVNPLVQDSGSGSLEIENYKDCTPLGDKGSGSSST